MNEISAFDLDRTLIKGNSSARFCLYLWREKVLPFSLVLHTAIYSLRHKFLGMSLSELHHSVFNKLLRGKPLELLESYMDKFVNDCINGSLYMPAFTRLKKAQQLGHYTMILSNAPSFIVKRFAKALNVNTYVATEYAVDEKGAFQKILKILDGKDKAKHLANVAKKFGVFLDRVTAYSDSIFDLEFLEQAGNPIVVNPDRKLRQTAEKKLWTII